MLIECTVFLLNKLNTNLGRPHVDELGGWES